MCIFLKESLNEKTIIRNLKVVSKKCLETSEFKLALMIDFSSLSLENVFSKEVENKLGSTLLLFDLTGKCFSRGVENNWGKLAASLLSHWKMVFQRGRKQVGNLLFTVSLNAQASW